MTDIARLGAAVDEDERLAIAASTRSPEWRSDGHGVGGGGLDSLNPDAPEETRLSEYTIVYDEGWPLADEARHIARHDPLRTGREVWLKRLILQEHAPVTAHTTTDRNGLWVASTVCNTCTRWGIEETDYVLFENCPYIAALAAVYPQEKQ